METTETQIDGSIESAIESIIAPIEEEKVEATEEETQTTEDATDVEETAEAEEVETDSEEDYDTEAEYDSEEVSELDEDNDQVEDAVQNAPSNIKVKIDGNEVEVTLDELRQGYSGQKYVQKGMQEAATQRKEAEQVYESLLNERKQMAQLFQ